MQEQEAILKCWFSLAKIASSAPCISFSKKILQGKNTYVQLDIII